MNDIIARMIKSWLFLCFVKVFCKLLAKGIANITIEKKLNKCRTIFHVYNDIQFRYGEVLDKRSDIVEIRCNVKIVGYQLGDNYTTDFNLSQTNSI